MSMKRLTIMTDKGAALVMGGPYESEMAVRTDLMERYKVAVARLAAYEDTGMMPEEIRSLLDDAAHGSVLGGKSFAWLMEMERAERAGRLVVLPEVPEGDRQAFVDGLHDYFQEAANYDPSVGIFGMREGEARLAHALMDALDGRREGQTDGLF